MRDDVEDVIDLVWIPQVGHKTNGFGIGHRSRKGLGEASDTRKFNDASLLVMVRAEIGAGVLKRLAHALHHPGDVPLVLRMRVDLQLNAVPLVTINLVARGKKQIEVQRCLVQPVLESTGDPDLRSILSAVIRARWRSGQDR